MAGVSEVQPTSFDSYEGIRIVIPGLILYAAGSAAFATISNRWDLIAMQSPVLGLVSALSLGLLLYYCDVPAKSVGYYEGQPTDRLEAKYPDRAPAQVLTAYLGLLNSEMPANIRNRSLYMGSMYRIGFEMVMSLGASAYTVFGASVFLLGPASRHGPRAPRLTAALFLVLVLVAAIAGAKGDAKRSAARSRPAQRTEQLDDASEKVHRTSADGVRGCFRHDCAWFKAEFKMRAVRAVYAVGVVCLVGAAILGRQPEFLSVSTGGIACAGLGLCFVSWSHLYTRGVVDSSARKGRRRQSSIRLGIMYAMPLLIVLLFPAGKNNVLGQPHLMVAWSGVAGAVLVLITLRGHERKLRGAYAGQIRWLEDNESRVDDALRPAAPSVSARRPAGSTSPPDRAR